MGIWCWFRRLALAGILASPGAGVAGAASLPPIGHVFVIVLENEGFATSFAEGSPARYLASELPAQGALLTHYYGIGHDSLDNYIAMISGQAPNPDTQADCDSFTEFVASGMTPDGQAIGHGCVYPGNIPTLAGQLKDRAPGWKAYLEDLGKDAGRDHSDTCGHPPVGAKDPTQKATATDQYATRHNPFVYFHEVIDDKACSRHIVALDSLAADLASAATTPQFALITPNLCHDGHDHGPPEQHCTSGEPGGLPAIDGFLRLWVPRILASPAFKADGLLIVTFDEADFPDDDPNADASACCNEPRGPNIPPGQRIYGDEADRGPGITGPGGGRVGAVLVSPFIRPGTVSDRDYNHYALLRTVEDLFGLPHLGYAGQADLAPFGPDVFTAQ